MRHLIATIILIESMDLQVRGSKVLGTNQDFRKVTSYMELWNKLQESSSNVCSSSLSLKMQI